MKDSEFRYLDHIVGNFKVHTRGTEVASGYKPDLTVIDEAGKLAFILECEVKTDRKAFLGDFIKAEKCAKDMRVSPTLIIVMEPQYNITVDQIARHLKSYTSWVDSLKSQGLSLAGVLVISDDQYMSSFQSHEVLGSSAFIARCWNVTGKPRQGVVSKVSQINTK